MMEVYIVFTDTKTSWAKLIKSYTRYPFSHVSLSFSKDLSQMYSFSFGRKQAGEAFSGFVKEDVRDNLFQQADCAVYKWELSEESYSKVLQYVQKMERDQEILFMTDKDRTGHCPAEVECYTTHKTTDRS